MKVNILGQEYNIIFEEEGRCKEVDANGLCEGYSKEIYIDDFETTKETVLNSDEYKRKVLRHELIHAFLIESGLDANSWARNEEMVDWFAYQLPKMFKVMKELNIID